MLTVQHSQLESYQDNFEEAVKKKIKGIANEFSAVATFPDIYLEKLKLEHASFVSVVDSTQKDLENLPSGLRNETEKRVHDSLCRIPPSGLDSSIVEDIVSQIYYAFLVEYSAKFLALDKMLSGLKNQIGSLED